MCSFVIMAVIYFLGENIWCLIFVDPSETDVIHAAQIYFNTVAWCYPFLGSIYLYRNALQGLGYGLVPMMGGVFEAIGQMGDRGPGGQGTPVSELCVCLIRQPGIAALIPLIPYYFWTMRKERKKRNGIKEGHFIEVLIHRYEGAAI